MCQDFGSRDFDLVTDGVTDVGEPKEIGGQSGFIVYFMGMFHEFYQPNFDALQQAFNHISQVTGTSYTLRIRSNKVPSLQSQSRMRVEHLPYADDSAVARDIEQSDFLFLPLPFGGAVLGAF